MIHATSNAQLATTAVKTAAATLLYGAAHSALASRQAKAAAARWLGQRQRNGFYRLLYNLQSVVTFAALLAYLTPLPDRELYRARGWVAATLRLGQVAALVYGAAAAYAVGVAGLTGLGSAAAWIGAAVSGAPRSGGRYGNGAGAGEANVPAEPEAQGPAPRTGYQTGPLAPGALRIEGPFRWSRHPLNLVPVPVLWLVPTMTVKTATFAAVSTVYLVLGSRHEERRLRAAYGAAYAAYQDSGVPFFIPRPGRSVAHRRRD